MPEDIPAHIKPEDVARYVIEQSRKKQMAAEENQSLAAFGSFMEIADRNGQYPKMIAESKKHIQAAPRDGLGYFYLGLGNYYDGDFGAALSAWQDARKYDPTLVARLSPLEARATRILRRFPGLKLGSIRMVESDMTAEKMVPFRLGKKLLQARNYDEIERVAQKLQQENRVGMDGYSMLRSFMDGLQYQDEAAPGDSPDLRWQRVWERLQQWKKARPNSVIASVAQLETQTNWAANVRGGAYASEVTEEQWAGMEQHLAKAAKIIAKLPPKAANFPLTGPELLGWGLYSSMPPSEAHAIWTNFNRKFPASLELARAYCMRLLPRWGGAPGEWEKLASSWANQAPGEAGDIRYAQLMMMMGRQLNKNSPYWSENKLDWPRTRRGLRALVKKHPQSLALATGLMQLSVDKGDRATAQDALIRHVKNRASATRFKSVREFALLRLNILDPAK